MVQVILFIVIIAMIIFALLKNMQQNRNARRHNRLIEKQEELLDALRQANQSTTQEDYNHENRL